MFMQNYPSLNTKTCLFVLHVGQMASHLIREWFLARISCSVDQTLFRFFILYRAIYKVDLLCSINWTISYFDNLSEMFFVLPLGHFFYSLYSSTVSLPSTLCLPLIGLYYASAECFLSERGGCSIKVDCQATEGQPPV